MTAIAIKRNCSHVMTIQKNFLILYIRILSHEILLKQLFLIHSGFRDSHNCLAVS